jgi:hypothetical protein
MVGDGGAFWERFLVSDLGRVMGIEGRKHGVNF